MRFRLDQVWSSSSLICASLCAAEFLNIRKIPLKRFRYEPRVEGSTLTEEAESLRVEMQDAILTDRDMHDRVSGF